MAAAGPQVYAANLTVLGEQSGINYRQALVLGITQSLAARNDYSRADWAALRDDVIALADMILAGEADTA